MSLVKCWYHYFLDRQACNNYAAYFFEHTLAQSSPPLGFRLVVTPPAKDTQKIHWRNRIRICSLWGAQFQARIALELETAEKTLKLLKQ